jgi:hypothetical protein
VSGRRPIEHVQAVLALKAEGRTDREVSQLTGVPVATIRLWRNRGLPRHARRALAGEPLCPTCGHDPHDFTQLPRDAYSYLLGMYLGDGHITRAGRTTALRIALDEAYPWIIISCGDAIEDVIGKRPWVGVHHAGTRCSIVVSYSKSWPCLLPQHGPGRKHKRKIELVDWQREIVDAAPEAFLRGLIHTDGWRGLNRVHVKGKDYAYPRYQFSNRSDDIRRLFTDTCERLGIEWRQWTRYHVSVARRESVALMDSFIGLKC